MLFSGINTNQMNEFMQVKSLFCRLVEVKVVKASLVYPSGLSESIH